MFFFCNKLKLIVCLLSILKFWFIFISIVFDGWRDMSFVNVFDVFFLNIK